MKNLLLAILVVALMATAVFAADQGKQLSVAPDLRDGFMILNYNGNNRWQTGIECVLVRSKEGGEEERAYLSHECRAENVSADPFSHPGDYEFVGISTWNGNYLIRSGSCFYGFNPFSSSRRNTFGPTYEKTSQIFLVSCKNREAHYLSFDEALELLQQNFGNGYKKLYIKATFKRSGYKYTIYAPANYINFPSADNVTKKYLQPISGYVLYEDSGRFFISYIVCHITDSLPTVIQFKVRDKASFVSTKEPHGITYPIFHIFDKPIFSKFFVMEGFYRTERMGPEEAQCEFFYY